MGLVIIERIDLSGVHELEDFDGVAGLLPGPAQVLVGDDHVEVLAVAVAPHHFFVRHPALVHRTDHLLADRAAAFLVVEVELQGAPGNGVEHLDGDGHQAALQVTFPDGLHLSNTSGGTVRESEIMDLFIKGKSET